MLAAGNEGFRRLLSDEGEFSATMPCSIGDPANLEEAIAGEPSTKRSRIRQAVSHFSSRGPTADGRKKLDCVAPGEQILSSAANPRATKDPTQRDLYYKLDAYEYGGADGLWRDRAFRRSVVSSSVSLTRSSESSWRTAPIRDAIERCREWGCRNLVKMLVQT